jgi:hypothetical protein
LHLTVSPLCEGRELELLQFINLQKMNRITKDEDSQVSPACAKRHVMRSCIQEENLYTPNCIRTFTGIYMNVFEPTLEMICIEDIAHALSMQCRFGGHLPEFYSVAEHSWYCHKLVRQEKNKLAALLHDASEAYLLDIPSPIKKNLSNYKEIEENLMKLIAEKFGFHYPLTDDIKNADEFSLRVEWECLMLKRYKAPFVVGLNSKDAENQFLDTFKLLQTVTAF